jgi:Tfp pilus assembly protein PilF
MKKGDLATALLHFREAVRINPRNANAQTGTGLAQIGLGQKEQAHESFAAALEIDIHDVTALYHLVKCAYELKKFGPVSELLRTYIKHNTVNSNILYSYSGILFHQGSYKQALEECEKLKELILQKLPT